MYIGGDFNARIYERIQQYEEEIGEYILSRKGYVTEGIAENTRDNRNRFLEFLKTHDYTAANTRFRKPPQKVVTYKEKVPQHNPTRTEYDGENAGPYDYTKYA